METFLFGLATFAIVCASPGPAVLAMVTTAMARGMGAAMRLNLGLTLALGVWGLFAAAGFGAVLAAAPSALIGFKVGGGAYLLWLAWGAGCAAIRPASGTLAIPSGFRAGLILNLSNPKAVFAWTATIAVGTPPDMPGLAWLLVPLTMVATVLIYAIYGLIFSRPLMRGAYASARRWIDGVASGLFALAGLALMRDGAFALARRS